MTAVVTAAPGPAHPGDRSLPGRRRQEKETEVAERHRSKDGHKETDEVLGESGTMDQKGRAGGRLSRRIGSRDELKRATERPAGATRVRKRDEQED